ncbi:MAG: AAA family ATPase [Thermodesulfobacteriota bacterium]|nr:AAA family ATPase [Thermodesulfobacteriota bacterium]
MQMESNAVISEDQHALIFEYSGHKVEPESAEDMWSKILEHKWALSEKLGRDVGIKTACVDFVENIEPQQGNIHDTHRIQLLRRLGAQRVRRSAWSTISDSQPPKQIVEKRIVLPLTQSDLARKHGVSPPRTIIFFGPPGTGKTHFARAIAARLQWWYIEVSPSDLMGGGEDHLAANLKKLMEKARNLDEVVLFIDEFEEIAGSRDQASRIDKSITNEFLKQVPLLRHLKKRNLLVCATNYIRQLDPALLRPGRFDCIMPVGELDGESRRIIFEHYLKGTNHGDVDLGRVVSEASFFTPADIEYLIQKVSQFAFEKESIEGKDYRITTETFLGLIPEVVPTLSEESIRELEEDSAEYARY